MTIIRLAAVTAQQGGKENPAVDGDEQCDENSCYPHTHSSKIKGGMAACMNPDHMLSQPSRGTNIRSSVTVNEPAVVDKKRAKTLTGSSYQDGDL